jgi:hypothetical protein
MKKHLTKILAGVATAAILAVGTFLANSYSENAWASDIQQMRTDWKEERIIRLRRELNEIEQKEQDGKDTKYDRLRKKQLERDYNELLEK